MKHAIYPGNRQPGAHIAVNGIGHRYRRNASDALSGINFEVQPSEAVALVGRSGCGKSTLLHILSGLTMPTVGEVRIDGARLWVRRRAGSSCSSSRISIRG